MKMKQREVDGTISNTTLYGIKEVKLQFKKHYMIIYEQKDDKCE